MKETATHMSILAWRVPRTEEPGRLQSMGLQRFGHNRATFAFIGCAKHIRVNMYYQCWNQKSLENCDEPIENKASYTRKKITKEVIFLVTQSAALTWLVTKP